LDVIGGVERSHIHEARYTKRKNQGFLGLIQIGDYQRGKKKWLTKRLS
jgi:hypothetical protein